MDLAITDDAARPEVRLSFSKNARSPTGALVRQRVASMPARRFDGASAEWRVRGFGVSDHPAEILDHLGFEVSEAVADLLDELWYPLITVDDQSGQWLVYPRLAGFEAVRDELCGSGVWDRSLQAFRVEDTDLLDAEGLGRLSGVEIPDELADGADELRWVPEHFDDELSAQLTETVSPAPEVIAAAEEVAELPDAFGGGEVELFDFQIAAAHAVNLGRGLLSLPMGGGKTLCSLAAAALAGTQRLLVVVPPVAVTGWAKEAARSMAPVISEVHPDLPAPKGAAGDHGAYVRAIYAGRKVPEFPEAGVVIVPDSLIGRESIRSAIDEWEADYLIVDEAHRFRTWDAKRSTMIRDISAGFLPGRRVALTGTPMLNHPGELANQLAITSQLHSVFGSQADFLSEFTRTDKWGKLHARKNRLKRLGRILDERVWVMHTKADILPQLPGKHRTFVEVDVELADYRAAHAEVVETIVERHGGAAELAGAAVAEVAKWADEADISLISPMRRASGLAKVDTAVEMITQMREDEDSPLVVFAHHQQVVSSVAEQLSDQSELRTATLDGSTSSAKRGRIEEDFQNGGIDVLVASIAAAGVAITLTASHRVLFVESDWTPGNNIQAEDRCDRIGQRLPVEVTSMIAAGTVDEHLHRVLDEKIGDLQTLTGSQTHGQAATSEMAIREVIAELYRAAHSEAKRQSRTKKR